nr:MAG TPA: hypothetical protein [Caudoviricetes sp.]
MPNAAASVSCVSPCSRITPNSFRIFTNHHLRICIFCRYIIA